MLTLKVLLGYPIQLESDGNIPEDIYESLTWLTEYFNIGDWSYKVVGGYITALTFKKVPEEMLQIAVEEIKHLYDDCEFLCT